MAAMQLWNQLKAPNKETAHQELMMSQSANLSSRAVPLKDKRQTRRSTKNGGYSKRTSKAVNLLKTTVTSERPHELLDSKRDSQEIGSFAGSNGPDELSGSGEIEYKAIAQQGYKFQGLKSQQLLKSMKHLNNKCHLMRMQTNKLKHKGSCGLAGSSKPIKIEENQSTLAIVAAASVAAKAATMQPLPKSSLHATACTCECAPQPSKSSLTTKTRINIGSVTQYTLTEKQTLDQKSFSQKSIVMPNEVGRPENKPANHRHSSRDPGNPVMKKMMTDTAPVNMKVAGGVEPTGHKEQPRRYPKFEDIIKNEQVEVSSL